MHNILGRALRTGYLVAQNDGMRYFLTDCCQASAKGSMDAVVCRACYREVDDAYGGAYDERFDGPIVPLTPGGGTPAVGTETSAPR
jgi:hypothetical protein